MFTGELIGQRVEVVKSTNPSYVGLEGTIVDETRQTLVLRMSGRNVVLLKRSVALKLVGSGIVIKGDTIIKRSEERVKGK